MVLSQQIPRLEMSSISVTTAGKSIAAGYFNYRSLLEMRIRQGQAALEHLTATALADQRRRSSQRHRFPNEAQLNANRNLPVVCIPSFMSRTPLFENFTRWCRMGISKHGQVYAVPEATLRSPEFDSYWAEHLLINIFEPKWPRKR